MELSFALLLTSSLSLLRKSTLRLCFKKWKELGNKILACKGVQNVISEATLFSISNNKQEEKFEVHRIFYDTTFREKGIDSIRKEIKINPLFNRVLFNDSSKVSLLMIGLDEKILEDRKKSKVVFEIEEIAENYKQYFGKMMSTCMRYLGNKDDAMEVLNTGFLKVFQSLDKYDRGKSLDAWIYSIVRNSIIDRLRSNLKYREIQGGGN